ncbi:glycerophosphodiester phosphodiesterase [Schleiferilactobacillus perolens]|nr:glycerophosphodiester phosphodiesterase [Schleiferilactobacillus perolens]
MFKHSFIKGVLLLAATGVFVFSSGFMIIGHRGEYFSHHYDTVEHTYRSYDNAIRDGATMLEIDLEQSSDGVLVVSHDPTTTRLSGQRHVISDTPWATLRQLPYGNGENLKSLQEVLLHYRAQPQVQFMIETRLVNGKMVMEHELAKLVAGLGLQNRVVYESFIEGSLLEMKKLQPGARTLLLLHPGTWLTPAYIAAHRWTSSYGVWWPQLSGAAVNNVHDAGQEVYPWPFESENGNEAPDEYALGVDGVITNWSYRYKKDPDATRVLKNMAFHVTDTATLYAGAGSNAWALRKLPKDSRWRATKEITVRNVRWYQLGRNQWVKASDGILASTKTPTRTAALAVGPDLIANFESPFFMFEARDGAVDNVLTFMAAEVHEMLAVEKV